MDRVRLAVWAHAAVMVVHGIAHSRLGVVLSTWDSVFVALVIGIGPIAGLVLLSSGWPRMGAAIVAATMAASLVFGLWNHFVVVSADHVGHLPDGLWKLPFQVSAWLLLATEAFGSMAGAAMMREGRQ